MTNQVIHHSTTAAALNRGRFSVISWLMGIARARRSRRHLASLEPHMLDDIGVTARAAQQEQRKPLWDVPGHWLK